MAQYASLEEAFGGAWGSSKPKAPLPKEQDVHSTQKTYNSPTRRTEAAIANHSKLIEDTLKTLPYGEDSESNYAPARLSAPAHSSKNQIEPFSVFDYKPPAVPGTGDWSYASTPSSMGQVLHFDQKLDKMMKMMEGYGGETSSTHDLLLYIFTGVFALFVLDSFVSLGKLSRR